MIPRRLTEKDVEFSVTVEPEHIPVEGNVLASGDDVADREAEQWVIDQITRGNEYAWCSVLVYARWEGFEGIDSLGACSYQSREDLARDLLPEMKANALDALNAAIEEKAELVARFL